MRAVYEGVTTGRATMAILSGGMASPSVASGASRPRFHMAKLIDKTFVPDLEIPESQRRNAVFVVRGAGVTRGGGVSRR